MFLFRSVSLPNPIKSLENMPMIFNQFRKILYAVYWIFFKEAHREISLLSIKIEDSLALMNLPNVTLAILQITLCHNRVRPSLEKNVLTPNRAVVVM